MEYRNLVGWRLAASLVLAMGLSATAVAQTRSEASRQLSRFGDPDVRMHRVEGNRPALSPGDLAVPSGHESFAPSGAEQIHFVLRHVAIEGATRYPPEELQAVFASRYGTRVSLADIYGLAGEIQRRYRDEGYFLSRAVVPPQRIVDGRMRIQVLEGYVDQVVLEGAVGAVSALIDGYLEPVTAERPLRLGTLERGLLLVNDLPGIDAKGVLQASDEAIGASRLVVVVSRKRFDGLLLLDNIGSTLTGEWEIAVRADANSFTRFGERLGVTGLISDPAGGGRERPREPARGGARRLDAARQPGRLSLRLPVSGGLQPRPLPVPVRL